jgi:TolA-binding protein
MNDQRNFELAIKSYRKIIADFPGSKQEPHAQFMIGYIYANVMDDSENARKEYSIFLQKYPDHELTPSVKFELDFIGKDINDIPQLKHITS